MPIKARKDHFAIKLAAGENVVSDAHIAPQKYGLPEKREGIALSFLFDFFLQLAGLLF